MVIMNWVMELFVYTLSGWHKYTRSRLLLESHFYIFNIPISHSYHIPNNLSQYWQLFLKVNRCLYSPVPCFFFSYLLIYSLLFYPFRSVDIDMISFAWSSIFFNIPFWCQAHIPLYISQLLRRSIPPICVLLKTTLC